MRKFRIPYIPYRSLLLSTTVLNDTVLNDIYVYVYIYVYIYMYIIGGYRALDVGSGSGYVPHCLYGPYGKDNVL